MPSPSDRDSWLCVEDMLAFRERVLRYTGNVEHDAFVADPMRYDATLRNLELIGEAANHVPDEVRAKAPSIPWRQVVATRNRLVHAYLGIDPDTVWSIVRDDVPPLHAALEALLDERYRKDSPTGG